MDVADGWLGTLLLAGLADKYPTTTIGIESFGNKISANSIKTKSLQDVKFDSTEGEIALVVKFKKCAVGSRFVCEFVVSQSDVETSKREMVKWEEMNVHYEWIAAWSRQRCHEHTPTHMIENRYISDAYVFEASFSSNTSDPFERAYVTNYSTFDSTAAATVCDENTFNETDIDHDFFSIQLIFHPVSTREFDDVRRCAGCSTVSFWQICAHTFILDF